MELYIEKEFLDNFYGSFDEERLTTGQQVIATIFKDYEEIEWFYDTKIDSASDLQELKNENPFFAFLSNPNPPFDIENFEEHLFSNSKFLQTLILTNSKKDWFKKAEAKGALCMSFEDYENRISTVIANCHIRIDLSKRFLGWNVFNGTSHLPINFISVSDNYVLINTKKYQEMDKNIIQILKCFLNEREEKVDIKVISKVFNKDESENEDEKKMNATNRHGKLHSSLANYKKNIQTINSNHCKDYDFHDRVISSNFFMIDSGKGFNLMPSSTPSNSQIIVESIFNKYTYRRLKNHLKMQEKYLKYLKGLPPDSFTSIS